MTLKYIIPILFISLFAMSCSTDDDTAPSMNEVEGLSKIQEITNNSHTIELYNESGMFYTGYNHFSIQIKDNISNTYVQDASIALTPMMQMPEMRHSCPKSDITKAEGKSTVYEGFVIYQMTNLDGSGWYLNLDYTIDGVTYNVTEFITVKHSEKQNVTSVIGADNTKYVLALIEPQSPKMAVNDLKLGLFKMESMLLYPSVKNYTISLDPRMPGMGNHTSPNNSDLSYHSDDHLYHGKLSLTMTGYWVLNLKLINSEGEVIKGEDVTENDPQSSLYLELEF